MHIDPAVVGAEPSEREVGLLGQRREGGEEEVGIPRLGAARRPLPLLGRVWWMEGSGRRLRNGASRCSLSLSLSLGVWMCVGMCVLV